MRMTVTLLLTAAAACAPARRAAPPPAPAASSRFTGRDVFDLEWATDPQISPDGGRVIFVRTGFDIMRDRHRSSLWIVNADGSEQRLLTDGDRGRGAYAPRWSPDGTRLLYGSGGNLYVRT